MDEAVPTWRGIREEKRNKWFIRRRKEKKKKKKKKSGLPQDFYIML